MMGRRARTLLPTSRTLLLPSVVDCRRAKHEIRQKQNKQARYFNRIAKDLPHIDEGDTVRIQPFNKWRKHWRKGTVIKRLDERSYEVETPEGNYRRNRIHIKKTREEPPDVRVQRRRQDVQAPEPYHVRVQRRSRDLQVSPGRQPAVHHRKVHKQTSTSSENTIGLDPQPTAHERQPPDDNNINGGTSSEQSNSSPVVTRSGRIVKVPARFKE